MSTPLTEVRTARPEEYDAIGELTAAVYVAEGYADKGGYATVLQDVAGRAAQATVLVALQGGRVVGAVAVATAGGAFAEQAGSDEAEVRMLATDPAARGTGVGTALMQRCLEEARRAGCRVVRLSTQASMTAAHRIYERLGFTRTPDRDWSPMPGLTLLTYELPVRWCGLCGAAGRHERCDRALELEPPRYCTSCRRRMVVQVTPSRWSARCSEHGQQTG